jgi:hypothetical protein
MMKRIAKNIEIVEGVVGEPKLMKSSQSEQYEIHPNYVARRENDLKVDFISFQHDSIG